MLVDNGKIYFYGAHDLAYSYFNSPRLYESSECQNYNCWTSLRIQNQVPPPAPTNTTQQSTASSSIPDHNTGADHPVAGDKLTATAKAESTAKYDSDNKNDSADRNLPTPPTEPPDLSTTIPGMYRILDLISEQGSGGLGKSDASSLMLPKAELTNDIISGQNHHFSRFSSRLCQYPISWGILLYDEG